MQLYSKPGSLKFATITALLFFFCVGWIQPVGPAGEIEAGLPHVTDSIKYIDVLNRVGMLFYEENADSTLYYAGKARELALRQQYEPGLADAANFFGSTNGLDICRFIRNDAKFRNILVTTLSANPDIELLAKKPAPMTP